jgi:2-polyprenyl-3-methyl-5-hydroxy-6-metoxy-1,4-benzoquinol methylase
MAVTDRPQAFWLDQLQSATQYNRWIVSQLLPDLGSSILEVGCGTGTFTELLAQTGSPVTAVDCDAAFVAMAQARLQSYANVQICLGDATQMQWQRSFDTVILLDVLEHIEHDRQLLQQLRQSLQPGGRLILKVPALSWLYSSLDRAIGHHRRYSRATLAEVLQQAGYSWLVVERQTTSAHHATSGANWLVRSGCPCAASRRIAGAAADRFVAVCGGYSGGYSIRK